MTSSLSCGIVGLPNVGKSTLFNALTNQSAPASNYPFCTIEPNLGIVEIPDLRLASLAKLSKSRQIVPAAMRFWDIAGLVEGASRGEGLGNQFLGHIRQVDALIHVVRCFEDEEITHVQDDIDPVRDIELINTELALADLKLAETHLAKNQKLSRIAKAPTLIDQALGRICDHLGEGRPVRSAQLNFEESEALKELRFLTAKPVLYVANIAERDLKQPFDNPHVKDLCEHITKEGAKLLPLCADLEAQISTLEGDDRIMMLNEVGLKTSGLDRLIESSFEMLGLITYLTTGEMETRAWTIKKGLAANKAAGKIHSDLERGFIRAEVITFEDYIKAGSRQRAREMGILRAESKEYLVCDGDVILFLHH